MKKIALISVLTLCMVGSAFAEQIEDPYEAAYEAALRRAREGLQRAMAEGKAEAEANRDPEMERLLEYKRRGYGSEPHQVLRQILDIFAETSSVWDNIPQHERNLVGLCNVYKFYIDRADFERASKTAQLIQKAYDHATRRFDMIVKATEQQDAISESTILVETYAGLENVTELKLSRIEDGSVRVSFKSKEGGFETRILRSPKALGASLLGVPVDAFESELKLAAQ